MSTLFFLSLHLSDDNSFLRQINRPDLQEEDVKKIIGLQVRNFPPTVTEEDVVTFLKEKVDENITQDAVSFMKHEHSISAAIETGLKGDNVIAATKEIEFRQSKKKFFGKPLYCRILKNLTPVKVNPPPSPAHAEASGPVKDLHLGKNQNLSKPSVK